MTPRSAVSPARALQIGDAVFAYEERAEQIQFDRPPEFLLRRVGHARVIRRRPASGIAQDVDLSEGIRGTRQTGADILLVGDVEPERNDPFPAAAGFGGRLGEIRMDIARQYARAFCDELLADGGTDAAPRSGHERDLAVQPAHFMSPSCS